MDRATAQALISNLSEDGTVVGRAKRNDRKAGQYGFFQEPSCVVRRDSPLQRQGCQRRVDFGQGVRRAKARVLAARMTPKLAEGRLVGAKLVHKCRDHHRCVEQRAHSANVAGNAGVSCLSFSTDELANVHRSACGAMMDENALLANERWLFVGPTKRDPVGGGFDLELTPGSQVELLPEGFRHNQPSCNVNGNDHAEMVFDMAGPVNEAAECDTVGTYPRYDGLTWGHGG